MMEMMYISLAALIYLGLIYGSLSVALYFAVYRRMLGWIRSTRWRVACLIVVRPIATTLAIAIPVMGLSWGLADMDEKALGFTAFMLGYSMLYVITIDFVVGAIAGVVSSARSKKRAEAEG